MVRTEYFSINVFSWQPHAYCSYVGFVSPLIVLKVSIQIRATYSYNARIASTENGSAIHVKNGLFTWDKDELPVLEE